MITIKLNFSKIDKIAIIIIIFTINIFKIFYVRKRNYKPQWFKKKKKSII